MGFPQNFMVWDWLEKKVEIVCCGREFKTRWQVIFLVSSLLAESTNGEDFGHLWVIVLPSQDKDSIFQGHLETAFWYLIPWAFESYLISVVNIELHPELCGETWCRVSTRPWLSSRATAWWALCLVGSNTFFRGSDSVAHTKIATP